MFNEFIWNKCTEYGIQQKYEEFIPFLNYALENKSTGNALEIGVYNGGTSVGLLHVYDNLLSIDMFPQASTEKLKSEYPNWKFYNTDSHNTDFINNIIRPYIELNGLLDCLMIDGDHSEQGAYKDFSLYKEFVRPGGMIVFHDVINSLYHRNAGYTVANVWNRLKNDYEHKEFICMKYEGLITKHKYLNIAPSYEQWGGIGVLIV